MDEHRRTYIAALETEIASLRGNIAYLRTSLLVTLTAVSSLFWTISNTIGEQRLGVALISDIAPFAVSAIYFVLAAISVEAVYAYRASPTSPDRSPPTIKELLPHDLVIGTLFIAGAFLSVLATLRYWNAVDPIVSMAGVILFLISCAMLALLGLAVVSERFAVQFSSLAAAERSYLSRIIEELEPRRESPLIKRYIAMVEEKVLLARTPQSSSRSSFKAAMTMSVMGILSAVLGWQASNVELLVSLAVQFTGLAVLLAYSLERIQFISDRLASIDAFEEERRTVITDTLKSTPYEKPYSTLLRDETYGNLDP